MRARILFSFAVMFWLGCGDDSKSTPDGNINNINNVNNINNGNNGLSLAATELISATEGGELALSNGALLTIPPNALSEDMEVTFQQADCPFEFSEDQYGGCPYELVGVDELLQRAEVSLPIDGDCLVASSDRGWQCLPDSTAADDAIQASFQESRRFGVNINASRLPTTTCVDGLFEPCGGDPVGKWEILHNCGTIEQITRSASSSPSNGCSDDEFYEARQLESTESLEFFDAPFDDDPDRKSAMYTEGGSVMYHSVMSPSCQAKNPDVVCGGSVCSEKDGNFVWLFEEEQYNGAGELSWRLDDKDLLYLNDQPEPTQHCIEGDRMTILQSHPDGDYLKVFVRVGN